MKRVILLAGGSASGKSTLARALAADGRYVVSTSAYLRAVSGAKVDGDLYRIGHKMDMDDPSWLRRLVNSDMANTPVVVDAIRSKLQHELIEDAIRVNVVVNNSTAQFRAEKRGRAASQEHYLFENPDFTWNSEQVSLTTARAVINQLVGRGSVDVLIGGQYGSEGKGKLAALLAPNYGMLVRSGGPNAGHWVRDEHYEFCFHHIPSGAMANHDAVVCIAAGATLGAGFMREVEDTGVHGRLVIDPNTMTITPEDIERESVLVDMVGSTAQGVGACTSRRILRGFRDPVTTAADHPDLGKYAKAGDVATHVDRMVASGRHVMLEGTQGSALSIYHGPYPYTTSRDTNVAGMLSEVGVSPSAVRDVWMVVRSFPIRVGGNSGPMRNETSWEQIARRTGVDPLLLKSRELTSTTKRQRRVGEFDWLQFERAVMLNRPSKLFLTFADYIDPAASEVREWSHLPDAVQGMVAELEMASGALVAGISTGRRQADVCWRV